MRYQQNIQKELHEKVRLRKLIGKKMVGANFASTPYGELMKLTFETEDGTTTLSIDADDLELNVNLSSEPAEERVLMKNVYKAVEKIEKRKGKIELWIKQTERTLSTTDVEPEVRSKLEYQLLIYKGELAFLNSLLDDLK